MNFWYLVYVIVGVAFFMATEDGADDALIGYEGLERRVVKLFLLTCCAAGWPFLLLLVVFRKIIR